MHGPPLHKSLVRTPHPTQLHRRQSCRHTTTKRAALAAPPAEVAPPPPDLSANIFPDLSLKSLDVNTPTDDFDLVIAGAGPSGLAVADRVSAAGFKCIIIDPNPLAPWINNYGVWCDEFEALGLDDCFDTVWQKAVVHLDSTPEGERNLLRPYARVDRPKLKRKLLERCIARDVTFHLSKVETVNHDIVPGKSEVVCSDSGKTRVYASLVLDATGHSRKLVQYDKEFNPGYQGAYGITAEVEAHPFDNEAMLFMDWRDDHLNDYPRLKENNSKLPTFLYAMPFSPTKVFLEETSLVARPIIPFPELKERLTARLKWLGITVKAIEEEEYCAIPMGGCLPKIPQRILGIGGTAGMVHPSTGYMVSRVLGAAPTVADAIIEQLSSVSDKAVNSDVKPMPRTPQEAEEMTAKIWATMWPVQRLRQRAFFDFGMEVLLKLDLSETREFFSAFFSLSDFHWQGFLSARLGFMQLIGFGLSLFVQSSNQARLNLLQKGLPGLVVMLTRLSQTFGKM